MLNEEDKKFLAEQIAAYKNAENAVIEAQTQLVKIQGGLDMFAELMRRKYEIPEGMILNSKGEFVDKNGKVISG